MNPDVIVGSFAAVFSIAYTIAAWELPSAAIGNPMAPKYFPLVVGAMAIIFSVALLIRGVKKGSVAKKAKTSDKGYWILIAGLMVLCLAYAAILEKIGFIISTILFLGAMLFLVNGVKGWKTNILTALCFTLGIWYIFEKVFMITLP